MARAAAPTVLTVQEISVSPTMAVVFAQVVGLEKIVHKVSQNSYVGQYKYIWVMQVFGCNRM